MCDICNNSYPNCPVCSPEPKFDVCPECKGEGYLPYCDEGEEVTEECEECKGEGMIEYELDYDY